jgi:hypothetical protein
MASTFSDLLKIELIGDGEQSGSWGTTTNNNLSQSLEHSIAGVLGVNTSSSTAVTLTTGNGPQAQADNQARQASLIFSGASANCVVTVPATQKIYNVHNTNTSYTITLRLSGTSTDYVIPASSSALISTTGAAWHALAPGTFTAGGTISNTSLDITIDAARDIILDAGGADITLKDDGTHFGTLGNDASNFAIVSAVSDKDIIFKGNDGGSTITALTLDMSAAGAATFEAGVTAPTGTFASGVTMGSTSIVSGTLSHSGTFLLDVATDITLDAGGGDIRLKDDGTTFGNLANTSGNLIIQSGTTTAATFSGANVTFAGTLASGAITSSGAITASGDVTAFSDARLKTGIRNIDNALNMVGDMRGVYFIKDGEAGTGVIAQEVEKILPEVVKDGEYKSVAYGNIVGVLIEAIKELKKEVETLKESK